MHDMIGSVFHVTSEDMSTTEGRTAMVQKGGRAWINEGRLEREEERIYVFLCFSLPCSFPVLRLQQRPAPLEDSSMVHALVYRQVCFTIFYYIFLVFIFFIVLSEV